MVVVVLTVVIVVVVVVVVLIIIFVVNCIVIIILLARAMQGLKFQGILVPCSLASAVFVLQRAAVTAGGSGGPLFAAPCVTLSFVCCGACILK